MLNNGIKNDPLFAEINEIVKNLGLVLVDVKQTENGPDILINIFIAKESSDASIDDCAKVHRAILPRMELKYAERGLQMEVSTPGLQRNLKDVYEFSVFKGRRCRVFDSEAGAWINGVIEDSDEKSVTVSNYEVEDSDLKGESMTIGFDRIQKAKLDFKWEDVKKCPN